MAVHTGHQPSSVEWQNWLKVCKWTIDIEIQWGSAQVPGPDNIARALKQFRESSCARRSSLEYFSRWRPRSARREPRWSIGITWEPKACEDGRWNGAGKAIARGTAMPGEIVIQITGAAAGKFQGLFPKKRRDCSLSVSIYSWLSHRSHESLGPRGLPLSVQTIASIRLKLA